MSGNENRKEKEEHYILKEERLRENLKNGFGVTPSGCHSLSLRRDTIQDWGLPKSRSPVTTPSPTSLSGSPLKMTAM